MPKPAVLTETDINNIIDIYKKGKAVHVIMKDYKISEKRLRAILLNNDVKIRDISHANQKYSINENFFNVIDTQEKAYVLGLLYADGYLYTKKTNKNTIYYLSLALQENDKELLDKVNNVMINDRPLLYIKPKADRYSRIGLYRLSVTNKKIATDLITLGYNNKTILPQIPCQLMHHFIRGLFDGDGCVYICQGIRKDYDIHIMGEQQLLLSIREILQTNGIVFSMPVFIRNIYRIRKTGFNNIVKFRNYIYKDATIYMQRKYDKFAVLDGNV